jgi:uncharacterized transporter YbjL
MITGLSRSVARFQIFSTFTNSGYTTGESELIMYNRLRRKICLAAMITGYLFSTLVTALVVGVVAGLNFKDSEYTTVYWERIFIVLGITVLILIAFYILTKVPVLRKWFYNILKKIIQPESLKKGNPITYEELVFDRYIAQVELQILRPVFEGTPLKQLDFRSAGITVLLIIRNNEAVDTKDMPDIVLQKGDIIQVFGSAADIEKVFSMR